MACTLWLFGSGLKTASMVPSCIQPAQMGARLPRELKEKAVHQNLAVGLHGQMENGINSGGILARIERISLTGRRGRAWQCVRRDCRRYS